jgi:catechol 2,3-dioxygenase-like lactoylglutathione lyase family enzyme
MGSAPLLWLSVGPLKRIAPIFPVADVSRSLEFYGRLGFSTRSYNRGYGFVTWGRVELHVGAVPDPSASRPGSAYIWVEDADQLATQWLAAGADVRTPEDTEWNQHEGAVIDPDGNIIRFGTPLELKP